MSKQKKSSKTEKKLINRRDFIAKSGLAVGAAAIVPRYVLGGPGFVAPSDKLNIAVVGTGGKGRSDVEAVIDENIVALCDVDEEHLAAIYKTKDEQGNEIKRLQGVKGFSDYRVMLDKMGDDIDAVMVITPDHTHAVIAMEAMNHGKHVYVQKPLTHTVFEARKLAEKAKEKGLVTQMGNQGHAGEGARLINEWIWDGAIGDVTEVHAWTNRPLVYWPQPVDMPELFPIQPTTINWDVWLGPAKKRPYHPAYGHFVWRGWRDFGTGALGDMGAHIIDHPYWALGLEYPDTVQGSSSPFNDVSYPGAEMVTYQFPARGDKPPVKFVWYDGGLMPPRPEELEPGRRMGESGGGVIMIGSKGKLMHSVYGANPRLIPEEKMKAYKRPEKTIKRSPGIQKEWIEACKGNGETTSNFGYASRLTETMLLGNIAVTLQDRNKILEYDSENMRFTNLDEANEYLQMPYRQGWSL
jgi:predicted dehydrogenase